MSTYTKEYHGTADAIITECFIFPAEDLVMGSKLPHFYTNNAVWDTGADTTIITQKVMDTLQLKPLGKGGVEGIGGFIESSVCPVHIGLPCGEIIPNFHVMVVPDDMSDYDVIIGMDIIRGFDFAITNPNGNTKFTYERPSRRDLDFTTEV